MDTIPTTTRRCLLLSLQPETHGRSQPQTERSFEFAARILPHFDQQQSRRHHPHLGGQRDSTAASSSRCLMIFLSASFQAYPWGPLTSLGSRPLLPYGVASARAV